MQGSSEGGALAAQVRRNLQDDGGTSSHLSDYVAWAHSVDPNVLLGMSYPTSSGPAARAAQETTTSPPAS